MSATVPMTENIVLLRSAESEILTPEAMEFLRLLDLRFEAQRISLLSERVER
jgi:hypothetical protein